MAADAGQAATTIIAIVVSNLEFGGAQQQIVELGNNLDRDRFELHVISLSTFVPLAEHLKIPADRLHVVAKRWKFDVTVVPRLAKLLKTIQADVVHGFLFDAEIAARLAGWIARTPAIVGSERNCDYSRSTLQLLAYRATKSLETICVANSHAGAAFNGQLLGYPESHYAVVHNGVNTTRFFPGDGAPVRRKHGIGDDRFVVGFFGSFKAQKNHAMFFRAARRLADRHGNLTFLLVGDQLHGGIQGSDRYKDEINELVNELDIRPRCVFAGNQEQVEDYYRACDITVLPSHHEGMPNVVLESLASGIPVVATNVSDNAMLVPDGSAGFLIQPGNSDELVERVAMLVGDGTLLQEMSRNARAWIEDNFSAERMAAKMGQVYEALR